MTIQLSQASERLIRSLVQAGAYPSEEEVINEALRLLDARDALRRDIAIGMAQADHGELQSN